MTKTFPGHLRIPAVVFIIYCAVFSYNYLLGVDLMEARNFVTAREMVEYGNWLVPTMNGELRITKPPLPTWLVALSMKVVSSDANLAANRFATGLAALILLAFFYRFALVYTGCRETSLVAALVLATSYMYMYMSRRGNWDMTSHTFIMGAIFMLYQATGQNSRQNVYLIGAGICTGLSFMSKGPVSIYILLLPFLFSEMLSGERVRYFVHWRMLVIAILVALLLGMAWPAYLYYVCPDDLARIVATETASWTNRHLKPFYWYLQFPAMSGIWILFFLPALYLSHSKRILASNFPTRKVIGWLFLSLLLLSLIPEKKDRYLLPVTIPMALLTGAYMTSLIKSAGRAGRSFFERHLLTFSTWFFTALSTAGMATGLYCSVKFDLNAYSVLITLASALMLVSYIRMLYRRETPEILYCILAFALVTQSGACLTEKLIKPDDYMEILQLRNRPQLLANDFYAEYPELKAVWALGKRIYQWNPDSLQSLHEGRQIVLVSRSDVMPSFPGLDKTKFDIQPDDDNKLQHWQLYLISKKLQSSH
ncbi:MAG: hypothetical protein GQF41_2360 [Candidatus Rifleibacterium amylolyticum]|nr:MAG: hypothetical protein GQF41_2360 [Candidatus Rifleibacterium amylolyticum]